MPTKNHSLPDGELEIMKILWSSGRPLSASEIAVCIRQSRSCTTAAVHVLLNRLCERGFIAVDKSEYVHLYSPIVGENEHRSLESRSFLERICGGSLKNMVASLIEADELDDEDISELYKILESRNGDVN